MCLNCKYVQESNADELKPEVILAPNEVAPETFKQPLGAMPPGAMPGVLPGVMPVVVPGVMPGVVPPPPVQAVVPPPPPVQAVVPAAGQVAVPAAVLQPKVPPVATPVATQVL